MTRVSEKLRLSSVAVKPGRFLSLKITHLSVSTLRLCKFLLRKLASRTVTLFSMEDFIADGGDYLWDLDMRSGFRPQRRFLDEEDSDFQNEKVYLVSYGWWKEVHGAVDQIEGVLYTVLSDYDAELEIVLDLRKKEDYGKSENADVGFSGPQYALVPEGMWLRALKRLNDFNLAVKNIGSVSHAEDHGVDVFPLQIRLSVSRETNSLLVKISQKDNVADSYKKACKIFLLASKEFYIWDFSGKTTQFFINDKVSLPNDSPGQPGKLSLLQLQVHGLSGSARDRRERISEMTQDESRMESCSHSGYVVMNGSIDNVNPNIPLANSLQSSAYRRAGYMGLTGLQNLGNTCFMNSALQCLVHTPEIVDYFLGDYQNEINYENPLGMNGELALTFGDLVRKLWVPGARPVAPRMFKMKLSHFAPQFSGYNQHDSHELLAFLLDGLHEDLNRVKCKPYNEVKDAEGRPVEEVAEEYWRNHLARNDSIIVDLFQGQFRSTLVCPVCHKVSITFDPFMYLSLPLPSTTMRSMTLTVLSTDGVTLPSTYTLTVPKYGRLKDLIDALSATCSLKDDETLLVAEIYKNRIFRLLEEPSDSLALIRDEDKLVAYRLKKASKEFPLVVFMHKKLEGLFGIPVVARMSNLSCGSDIHQEFLKLINPFLMPTEDQLYKDDDDVDSISSEDSEMNGPCSPIALDSDAGSDSGTGDDTHNMIQKYDSYLLNSLHEVFKPQLFTRRPEESVSLSKCLEAFLKEEPLGPEDMWYCPSCKKPQQASKKLDLWRLPEILVIHLKRFSYSRYLKNKLTTIVDFPVNDLDFSSYISHKANLSSNQYILYAIVCHYGGLGGGHYTAFIFHDSDMWYEFDDGRVVPVNEEMIRTSSAYVLFYRRVTDVKSDATV
ncbi:Ubiquitin carboxyl-terminal hydrolase [Quillaja saponaria]|uniref:Ubiquitin carboxyl-terminal hydrolase n=1 Tax=Quillaja saponaria TaxID=32244 RepID=A0AAD7PYU9_QUISA|nr:Ubiquitin carboxyl-terminal hydrolase [Quillaja saponaria]KAJ7971698.1 Ubiquitin carboxyl-terminal hydrolase [Quillaja saponaria]